MFLETSDPRRFIARWCTVLIIVTVASMIGIRTCSVRLRSHDSKTSLLQTAQQFGGVTNDPGVAPEIVQAMTGDPLSAFDLAVCAWNEIHIDGSDGGGSVVVGDLHNNASRHGEIRLDGDNSVYGDVTSAGTIAIGSTESAGPTTVHGSVEGDLVLIHDLGEVRDFLDLHEWVHGVDLNGDGDLDDLNVGKTPARVTTSQRVVCGGEELPAGGTDTRIADGTRAVEVVRARPGAIAYVYPDFRAYYETASGVSHYPPEDDHVASEIPGDGQAHYFASASAFLDWINSQHQSDVLCWRCAGDGSIDPDHSTVCPDCQGSGKAPAVETSGVFYIDDETLDLGAIETHLVIHGTIVVAEGNPYLWPQKLIETYGSQATAVDHFPQKGTLVIEGPTRMNLTQTHRADREGGPYVWRHREIHKGGDRQYVPVAAPEEGHALRNFPGIVAASRIVIAPRAAGFALCAGDTGDEAVTILNGIVFAGDEIRLGGRGGWRGDAVVFNEEEDRGEEDILDEAVLRIDLNDDGDVLDRLRLADISGRPVIRVAKGRYNIDINADGVLGAVAIGEDYGEFFLGNGFALPVLVHHEGILIGERVHIGGQCAVFFDPPARSETPFGFEGGSPDGSSPKMFSRRGAPPD